MQHYVLQDAAAQRADIFNFADPVELAEYMLHRGGSALMRNKFDIFADSCAYPLTYKTFHTTRVILSKDAYRPVFNALRAEMRRNSVTEMLRLCLAARFRDPDTLEATHVTRLMSGDVQVYEAYDGFTVAKRFNGVWKYVSAEYAIHGDNPINGALEI